MLVNGVRSVVILQVCMVNRSTDERETETRADSHLAAERSLLHLFETEREGAVGAPAADKLEGEVEGRGSRRAVVVDVVDGDAGHAGLVEGPLPACRVACGGKSQSVSLAAAAEAANRD